jgi:hypothetical protein
MKGRILIVSFLNFIYYLGKKAWEVGTQKNAGAGAAVAIFNGREFNGLLVGEDSH